MISNLLRLFLIFAVMVLVIGCESAVSQIASNNPSSKSGLVVYTPPSADEIRDMAKSHGLEVKILEEDTAATELVKVLLEVPANSTDPYFAVVNTYQNSYLTGGVMDASIEAEQKKSLFERLQKIQQAGAKQVTRLQPESKDHVRLVVFSDFQCPYCKQMEDLLSQWEKQYGERLEVEMVHFPLPFHEHAMSAAEASECARQQNKFDPYKDALFKNQSSLSESTYQKLAKDLGLNTQQFDQCLSQHKAKEAVMSDKYFGEYMGIKGTPSIFINGEAIQGVNSKQLESMIQEKLGGKQAG